MSLLMKIGTEGNSLVASRGSSAWTRVCNALVYLSVLTQPSDEGESFMACVREDLGASMETCRSLSRVAPVKAVAKAIRTATVQSGKPHGLPWDATQARTAKRPTDT